MRKLGFNLSGQHEDDTAIEEELQRYLSLLGVNGRLERNALLDDIRKHGIIAEAFPEVQQLFEAIENQPQPFAAARQAPALLEFLRSCEGLARYEKPVKEMLAVVTLQRTGKFFKRTTLPTLEKTLAFLSLREIEELVLRCNRDRLISVRFDFLKQYVLFEADAQESEGIGRELAQFTVNLREICEKLHSEDASRAEKHVELFAKVREKIEDESSNLHARKLEVDQ